MPLRSPVGALGLVCLVAIVFGVALAAGKLTARTVTAPAASPTQVRLSSVRTPVISGATVAELPALRHRAPPATTSTSTSVTTAPVTPVTTTTSTLTPVAPTPTPPVAPPTPSTSSSVTIIGG